jgi:hypothetical protein
VQAKNILAVKQFFADKFISVLILPLYLPDLVLCDFYLCQKLKSVLEGTHFLSAYEVKLKITDMLNKVSTDDLQHCLEQWNSYCDMFD